MTDTRQPEVAEEPVAQEDELIERIAVLVCRGGGNSLCVGFCHNERCPDAIEMYSPTARAILPFIHEARIEGGKMVQDKIVEWLRVQQHGRTSDNYPGYYARRIEDGEWR